MLLPSTIPIAIIHEADILPLADHYVVEHAHAHHFADLSQAASDVQIFLTRRRIAARMVMYEDDRSSRLADHWVEYLTRVNQGRGERPLRHAHVSDFSVLRVQQQDMKLFFLQAAEMFAVMIEHVRA